MLAMSDFVSDIDPGADEPLLGSAVIFEVQDDLPRVREYVGDVRFRQ